MNTVLVESTVLNLVTMQPEVIRLSWGGGGYKTLPSDDPPNAFYVPALNKPGNFQQSAFKDGLKGGLADGGFGMLQILNHDGWLNKYRDPAKYSFDGQTLRQLVGDQNGPYSGFVPVLTGTQCAPTFDMNMVRLKIRDFAEFFDQPLSKFTYLGTNVGGQGWQGTPDDLMGKTRVLNFGPVTNFQAPCISQTWQIYDLHSGWDGTGFGPIKQVSQVRVDGVAWPIDTTVGTNGDVGGAAALVAASPAAGKCCTWLAGGKLKLGGGAASGTVTVDLLGDNTGGFYSATIADIITLICRNYIRRIRKNYAPSSESFTAASGWTLSGFAPAANPPGIIPPVEGMNLATLSGPAGSSLSATLALGTGIWCLSWHLAGTGSVRLTIANPANPANNVMADFNLATAGQPAIQTNGQAVGPQYQGTGFVTAADVMLSPNGFLRVWLAGQPDTAFTALQVTLTSLDGQPVTLGGMQVENAAQPSLYTGPTNGVAAGTDAGGTYYAADYDPEQGPGVDASAMAALAAAVPQPVNYSIGPGDGTTAMDVINALCNSAMVGCPVNPSGNLAPFMMAKPSPSAAPLLTLTDSHILMDTVQSLDPWSNKDVSLAYRVETAAVKNWTVQAKTSLAPALWTSNPSFVVWLGKEWRQVISEDATLHKLHPLGTIIQLTSYLANLADAQALCIQARKFYGSEIRRFSFQVKMDALTLGELGMLLPGIVLALPFAEYGLTDAALFQVLAVNRTTETGKLALEVIG